MVNQGYSYREQLGTRAQGHTVLTYLVAHYTHSSPDTWQQRLTKGEVFVDEIVAVGDEPLRPGQMLTWHRPPWQEEAVPRTCTLVFEDDALIAVSKPSGLPTVPAGGFLQNTLLSLINETHPEAKPLHRLGRATSGLVLFARTPEVASVMSRAWREVQKAYRALAGGAAPQDAYEITAAIGPQPHPRLGKLFAASPTGKPALSRARVLERRNNATLFEVELVTGRPHQIRIHLASIGHPLVGDPVYAAGGGLRDAPGLPGDGGYLLHAGQLKFVHPVTSKTVELVAPVPTALKIGSAP